LVRLGNIMQKYFYWFQWTAKKIKFRDFLYIPRRLSYSIKKRFVDWTFFMQWRTSRNIFKSYVPSASHELLSYFRNRKTRQFHFCREEIDEIRSHIPSLKKEKTIRAAEDIVHRRFTFRGQDQIVLDPVDWKYSPIEGPDWTADLNRHFFFSQLGFAYWYTEDSRFAHSFIELSSDWIETNINQLGKFPWDDPFEVAARVNAWIWAYFLFLHCPDWNAKSHGQFLSALGKLTEYLCQTIEYHAPGNHILLEAKALVLCAELFYEFKGSQRWARKAWRILKREVKVQICSDGVHAERSTMYHRMIAGELSELMLFCHRNNISKLENFDKIIYKMAEFEAWISSTNGFMPLFGDAFLKDTYYRFSAPVIVSVLNHDDRISSSLLNKHEQTLWLLGVNLRDVSLYPHHNLLFKGNAKAFKQGGYFVSRSNWNHKASILVWDCGPVGYTSNPYHSHLDTLSFNLVLEGEPFLIDPGAEEQDIEIDRYLRGTAAHNTVLIDEENQSILAKRNDVWSPAQPHVILWDSISECDVMIGSHNGYKRLPQSVVHTRTIISMRHEYWLIFDQIEGEGRHKIEQKFHIAPDTVVEWDKEMQKLVFMKNSVELLIIPIRPSSNDLNCTKTKIENGLAELEYGRLQKILVINNYYDGLVPCIIPVVLVAGGTKLNNSKNKKVNISPQGDYGLIEVEGSEFTDKIFIRIGENKLTKIDAEWETDSKILIFRYVNNKLSSIFIVDASYLYQNSINLLDKSRPKKIEKILINKD